MSTPLESSANDRPVLLFPSDHPWLRPGDLSIPMLADQAHRVLQVAGDPEVTITTLAGLVSKDPVLATRVLGLSNSALYGAMAPLRSVSDAVVRLGVRAVRNVVVTVSMHSQVKSPDLYGAEGARFMEHAVGTAYVAHLVAEHTRQDVSEAFLCGLLHDIGKLVILKTAYAFQERHGAIIRSEELKAALAQHHASCGALALQFWNVPDDVRDTVQHHHAFEEAANPEAAAVCYAANVLSHRYGFGCQPEGDASMDDSVFAFLNLDGAWVSRTDERAPGLFNAARQALG